MKIAIDFEYYGSENQNLTLVCVSCFEFETDQFKNFWLYQDDYIKKEFACYLERNSEAYFFAWNVSAEAGSVYSNFWSEHLTTKLKWVDLQAEYKMIVNHYNQYAYGRQLSRTGEVVNTTPGANKWSMTEEEIKRKNFSRPLSSLLAAKTKLLGHTPDKNYKDKMRDIILSRDSDLITKHKKEIMEYCASDVRDLFKIWDKIKNIYRDYFLIDSSRAPGMPTMKEVLFRGNTVARQAVIERDGYPVNVKELKSLAKNIPKIQRELIEDINSQFDWKLFEKNKSELGYKQNQKLWKQYISKSEQSVSWMRTQKNDYSISLEAFQKKFSYKHDYPRGNFFAQAMRYLITMQALKGLAPQKGEASIFDSLGDDGRVRPYLNSYGSQSGRYQPKATSFLLLKSAWMRSLMQPKEGYSICAIDYKSEEALIGALNSNDKAMIEAYKSGDVYLDYAKRAKAVPIDATKKSHKKERDLFKSSYLGISYLMGAKSLAVKLTNDTGILYTEDQAQDLINMFYKSYPGYSYYLDRVCREYSKRGYIKLFDGWTMFKDNPNHRSISNMPVQGQGSCILRAAITLAQDKGLKIIAPLHDALYIEYPSNRPQDIDTLAECMTQAFIDCYPGNENASLIKLDIEAWGPDLCKGTLITPKNKVVSTEKIHIDPRGQSEYQKYSKYLTSEDN